MLSIVPTKVHLRYALRDRRAVSVKKYDYLRDRPHSDRPDDLICPECENRVMLKLSRERKIADHFAHYPDSDCPLRDAGETAFHLNAKIYMADRLAEFHNAALIYNCAMCRSDSTYLSIRDYDEVRPEMKLGRRRPDVSCLQGGEAVGAAEIFHTNAVSTERKYDLDASKIAWFEIPALGVHPQHFRFTEGADTLSIDARGAGVIYPKPPLICKVCEAREKQRAKAIEAKAAYDRDRLLAMQSIPLPDQLALSEEKTRALVDAYREQREREDAEREAWEQRGGGARIDAATGELVIPVNATYGDRFWSGGRSLFATLAALNAPLATWRRYSRLSPDLLDASHGRRCGGVVEKRNGFAYCVACGYYAETQEAA